MESDIMSSIRPIDMQTMVTQSQNLAKKHGDEAQKEIVNSDGFVKQLDKEMHKELTRVNKSENVEGKIIDEHNKKKHLKEQKEKEENKKNKENKEKNDENKADSDIIVDGHIDVII